MVAWIIFIVFVIGAVLLAQQSLYHRQAKSHLEALGIHADHYWAAHSSYITLDLKNRKIAIKGDLPLEKSAGEGVYDLAAVKLVKPSDDPSSRTMVEITVMPGVLLSEIKVYRVDLFKGYDFKDFLETMRRENIPPAGAIDMVIDDL